jgi:cold shock CspA family protein
MGLKINGTIKQYIKAKEFGFIAPDDGSKDVLVELRDFKGVCQASGINNQ